MNEMFATETKTKEEAARLQVDFEAARVATERKAHDLVQQSINQQKSQLQVQLDQTRALDQA